MLAAGILAQVTTEQVSQGVDVLDKVARGSVALVLLVLLVLAIIGLIALAKRHQKVLDDSHARELARETQYRKDAADLITSIRKDSGDAKAEQVALMRENHKAEKETDASIAAAARSIDRNATTLDRVERLLLRLEALIERFERKS